MSCIDFGLGIFYYLFCILWYILWLSLNIIIDFGIKAQEQMRKEKENTKKD